MASPHPSGEGPRDDGSLDDFWNAAFAVELECPAREEGEV